MYHSISESNHDRLTVAPQRIASEMRMLAEQEFKVVSLAEACRRLASTEDLARTIVLTFDDGHRDFLTTAAPVLRQHGFSATLFVVTGRLGDTAGRKQAQKT